MNIPLKLEGFERQIIEVQPAGMFTGMKLLVNGQPAPKGAKRGELLLRRDDGREVSAAWKPEGLGFDMPSLLVDGKVVRVTEPLPWYAWAWSVLPLALVFIGGALGGLLGAIAFGLNTQIFRGSRHTAVKFLLSGLCSAAAAVVWFILALLFTILVQGM